MDRIEYLADLIVRRGCGFALLASGPSCSVFPTIFFSV